MNQPTKNQVEEGRLALERWMTSKKKLPERLAFRDGFLAGWNAARAQALEEAAICVIKNESEIVRGHHILADAIRTLAKE